MSEKKQMTKAELDAIWTKTIAALPTDNRKDVGQRAPAVDWDEMPLVTGIVKTKEHATIDGDDREVMEVQTKDGPLSVWNNTMLQRLFDTVKVGQHVAIMYTGTRPLAGGRTLREFNVAIAGKALEG